MQRATLALALIALLGTALPGSRPQVLMAQQPGGAAQEGQDPHDRIRPAEARSRRLARTVPGYGGAAFDSAGNIVVYLTNPNDPGAVGAARSALAPVLRERAVGARERGRLAARPDVLIRKGDFTFEQLAGWRDRMEPVLLVEGVTYTDLDEANNRLTIGVDPATATQSRQRVTSMLSEAGVPPGAVRFVEQPPFIASHCSFLCAQPVFQVKTLSSMFRPIEGGVQFEGWHSAWAERARCTLGFIAMHGTSYVFVTAAHCTGKIGQVEQTVFGQPLHTDRVGVEYADPAFGSNWASTPYGQCGTAVLCRRADFALINTSSVTATNLRFGYIARPAEWAGGAGSQASTTEIYGPIPRMRIVGEKGSPEQWDAMDKIGWASGWTFGNVEEVCVDARHVEQAGGPNPLNIVFRCQHILGAGSAGGDSGGPYFKWFKDDAGTETVVLYGIHRAAAVNYRASFSSLDMIRLDMGLATTDRTTFRVY